MPDASTARTRSPSLPLWQLLAHCADAVQAVQAGHSLTEALDACPAPARPGTQALSFAVMRRLGLAQRLRALLVPRKPAPWVDALLLSSLALAGGEEYTAHTLVDQAVDAAKRRARPASGLVNAVLRRYLREQADLLAQAGQDPVARWNHPAWWTNRLKSDWPTQWEALLQANQSAAPLVLRVNRRHGSVAQYQSRLNDLGLPSRALGGDALVLERAVPVSQLPGFEDGDVSVQDWSAQQAASLLEGAGLAPGARVLDACSAPGGKTAHLLEVADIDLLALDADPQRLKRVDDTLARLRLTDLPLRPRTQAADAGDPGTWWDGRPFDAIVLDAPCSASGIVRRHPDVRWLRRPTDLGTLAATQDRLLEALWPLLAPGGHLLYCTCSLFRQEGEDRIDAFLQRHPDAVRQEAPGHLLPVVEYPDDHAPEGSSAHVGPEPVVGDGFFYALLSKPIAAH